MKTALFTLLILTQVLTQKVEHTGSESTTTDHVTDLTSTTTNNDTTSTGIPADSSTTTTTLSTSSTTKEPSLEHVELATSTIIEVIIVMILTCFVLALIIFICKNEFARTLLTNKMTQMKAFFVLTYYKCFRRIPDQSDNNNAFDIEEQQVLIMNKYNFALWYILAKICCCCLRKPIDYKIVDPQINDTIDNVTKEIFTAPKMTYKSWKIVLTKYPGKLIPMTKGPHGELIEIKQIEQEPLIEQFEIEENIIKDD